MKKSILITNSGINQISGGGVVSFNIIEALQSCSMLKYILAGDKFKDNLYRDIPAYPIHPSYYGYSNTDPFFMDYIAYHLIPNEPVDIAVTYGCPFGLVIEELKRDFSTKVVCDLAPHNIEVSKKEHMKFTGSYPYPHLTDEMLWGLYSRHLRFADTVIVHSRKSAEYIKEKARLKEEIDPVVLPHGCYLPEIPMPLHPEKFTPGYMGAIGFDKGITYLATAWANSPIDSKLVIGGREAASFTVQENIMKRFDVMGEVNNLRDFYEKISIYIQPSVVEGFGITVLEAMSYGRPVIVSEGAGVSELVEDSKNGFVVPPADAKAINDKIQYFYDNPSEIPRMGIEARKTAEKYSWEKIKNEYAKLFNNL